MVDVLFFYDPDPVDFRIYNTAKNTCNYVTKKFILRTKNLIVFELRIRIQEKIISLLIPAL